MNSNNQITKKQHYVPRFYLKNFTNKNNEVERLDCEKREVISPCGPKGICHDKYYFGFETGTQDQLSQDIEDAFQEIEYPISQMLPKIIQNILDYKQIDDYERKALSMLMSLIWMSGPKMRSNLNRITKDMMNQTIKSHVDINGPDKLFPKIDGEDEKVREEIVNMARSGKLFDEGSKLKLQISNTFHIKFLNNIDEFAKLFFYKYWIVYISKGSGKFITSDNPVVEINTEMKNLYDNMFIDRTHYFSLTPEILICVKPTDRPIYTGKKLKRKTLYEKTEDKVTILQCNLLQCQYSHKHAFATERGSLEEILSYVELVGCR